MISTSFIAPSASSAFACQLIEEQAPGVARATGELLAACLLPTTGNLEQARHEIEALQLARIRRFIDQQLGSHELSADDICRAMSLSRSHLYQLFKTHGGVRKYIQTRRLLRIHAALANPAETRSIMALAENFGFASHAHLSRAFRLHFGYSPSDLRHHPVEALHRRSDTLGPALHEHDGPGFDDWVRTLRV
ncbi:MAG TPA: helix-turn-helix domain-containing protein [Gammaproteobacteria bacterium]